jgi:hypothetical protein
MAKRSGKGSFSRVKLPLAPEYVYPRSRNSLIFAGGCLAALVAGVLAIDFLWGHSTVLSSGPVASAHAGLEATCGNCHARFAIGDFGADPGKCVACHEAAGDVVGVHTFDAHYVYRSHDVARAYRREGEVLCAACHPEHRGRDAPLTAVDNGHCTTCHGFRSFNDGHPQFDAVAADVVDEGSLSFGHIKHIVEIRNRNHLDDIEATCFTCHQPRADGRGFQPINFDTQCTLCHLGSGVRSANLPVRPPGTPIVVETSSGVEIEPGVETLETLRSRQGPGEQWALNMYPGDFRDSGRRVMKNRIEHNDPWIAHNLRQIRAAIYPTAELADLLPASAQVPEDETGVLYEESIATLREQAAGLQGQPEEWVQGQLEEVEGMLANLERRVVDQTTALDPSRFSLAGRRDPRLSDEQVDELLEFADRVSAPCQQCHQVIDATIARVQRSQQELRRAEFNHAPHVLQRRCLDCHARIPVYEYLDNVEAVTAAIDSAAIVNLPGIETCRQCHAPGLVSNACTTCHLFHPAGGDTTRLQLHAP